MKQQQDNMYEYNHDRRALCSYCSGLFTIRLLVVLFELVVYDYDVKFCFLRFIAFWILNLGSRAESESGS